MGDTDQLRAALRLHLADGVGARTYRRLIEAFGSPAEALAAGPDRWRRVEGIGPATCRAIQAVTPERVEEEIAAAGEKAVRILTEDAPDYPAALRKIHDPPAVLYVRGALEPADAVAVGVVGARRCTYYGREQAERFGRLLAQAGFTVVSGGARGIDTAAHEGALAVGGRTVAVMGCGLGTVYPRENAALFDRIVQEQRGALVSELPMAVGVQAKNFPLRNRIISGLSLGVLVVEAARRSGALITAREALEQGRDVFAVPGRVDSPMSGGTNELIRAGSAALVQGLDDILAELGDVGEHMKPPGESATQLPDTGPMDAVERRIVEALRGGAARLDELVRRTGLDSARVTASMTLLAIRGVVAQQPGQLFELRHARGERRAAGGGP